MSRAMALILMLSCPIDQYVGKIFSLYLRCLRETVAAQHDLLTGNRVPLRTKCSSAHRLDACHTDSDDHSGSASIRPPAYSRRVPDAGRCDRNLKETTVDHLPPT